MFDIDFTYSHKESFNATINIPDGYDVKSLPEGYKMDNELAEINIEYKKGENKVEVVGTYTFKQSVYQP